MEQPLWMQARQFLLAVLLGLAYGLHYDLLRGLRRSIRWLTHLLDLWFVLTYLAGNLLFALYAGGGHFRLFAFCGCFLGLTVYFLTLSRFFVQICVKFWEVVTFPMRWLGRLCRNFFKKMQNFTKNIFSSVKKSVTIKNSHNTLAKGRKTTVGGSSDAPAQIVTHYKAADSGHHDLRGRHNRDAANPDQHRKRRGRAAIR